MSRITQTSVSIANKFGELHYIPYELDCDFVFITESWLNPDICDGLLDPQSDYTILRHDRIGARGGDVCILIKNRYTVAPVCLAERLSDLEFVCFDLLNVKPILRFFYRVQTTIL